MRLPRLRRAKPRREPRVRNAVARGILRVPIFRRLYLQRLLKHLDETPKSQLKQELRTLQAALQRLPRHQRMGALETALRSPPAEELPSRSLRRAAGRQQKRLGR
jgi:hypothetical protein